MHGKCNARPETPTHRPIAGPSPPVGQQVVASVALRAYPVPITCLCGPIGHGVFGPGTVAVG